MNEELKKDIVCVGSIGISAVLFMGRIEMIEGLAERLYQLLFVDWGAVKLILTAAPGIIGLKWRSHSPGRPTGRKKKIVSKEKPLGFRLLMGTDESGNSVYSDLREFPHLLIGGSTGTGKSVFLNHLMSSLIKIHPNRLNLILMDFKGNEFGFYKDIPHLKSEIIDSPFDGKAIAVLEWLVKEMDRRYSLMSESLSRDMNEYNKDKASSEKLPRIVVVMDEFGDLILASSKNDKRTVETYIARLGSKARACGIHLILSTQRPDKDIVSPLIKANLGSTVCFKVKTIANSKIITDEPGAETLRGKGHMIFKSASGDKKILQGPFVEKEDILKSVRDSKEKFSHIVTKKIDLTKKENPLVHMKDYIDTNAPNVSDSNKFEHHRTEEVLIKALGEGIISQSRISRNFGLNNNDAKIIFDEINALGIVGESEKSNKPKPLLITLEDWLKINSTATTTTTTAVL